VVDGADPVRAPRELAGVGDDRLVEADGLEGLAVLDAARDHLEGARLLQLVVGGGALLVLVMLLVGGEEGGAAPRLLVLLQGCEEGLGRG